MDVRYLLDGSVVKSGDVVKISARLISASEDNYIWAKEYEREFINILVLHGEIAKDIADQINLKLTPQEDILLTKSRSVNPETYELYMKGMFHLNKLTPEGVKLGLSYLQQAVENDPNEPLVYAGLAIAYLTISHGSSYTLNILNEAKVATLNALKLDESLPEANLALAMVQAFYDIDWKTAIQTNELTLKLDPNLALAHYFYGYLLRIPGRYEDGYNEMIRAKQLDPLNPVYPADLGWMYFNDGKFDESIDECLKSIEINPGFPQAFCILGQAYTAKGMYEEALAANRKAGELSPDWEWGLAHTYALTGQSDEALKIATELEKKNLPWNSWCLAVVYAALGDGDKVFYWLEEAYRQHHPFIQWIGGSNNQYFGVFHDDSRFIDLAKRLNLPEYSQL